MVAQELLALKGRTIQGLYSRDPEGCEYSTLLARVVLGSFSIQAKVASKARVNSSRVCRDCEEATIHQTGSTLWISCRRQDGWRDINSQCNMGAL